jgi:hypothetical protein
VGLKLNGSHHLLVYDDDANLLGDNIDTAKKNTETLIDVSKEVGREVHEEKTKYMLLSRHQNAGKNHYIKVANKSFEKVEHFRYLATTVINQNLIQEEIKRRLNLSSACYHSAHNIFSSRLPPKDVKIRIYKIIILPVVLYGCETWFLTLREEHRLRVFEMRVLRRIFGLKGDEEVIDGWRKLHIKELHNSYSSPSIIRMIKSRRRR